MVSVCEKNKYKGKRKGVFCVLCIYFLMYLVVWIYERCKLLGADKVKKSDITLEINTMNTQNKTV